MRRWYKEYRIKMLNTKSTAKNVLMKTAPVIKSMKKVRRLTVMIVQSQIISKLKPSPHYPTNYKSLINNRKRSISDHNYLTNNLINLNNLKTFEKTEI